MRFNLMEFLMSQKYFVHIAFHNIRLVHAFHRIERVDNDETIPQVNMNLLIFQPSPQLGQNLGRVNDLQLYEILLYTIRVPSFLQMSCFCFVGNAVFELAENLGVTLVKRQRNDAFDDSFGIDGAAFLIGEVYPAFSAFLNPGQVEVVAHLFVSRHPFELTCQVQYNTMISQKGNTNPQEIFFMNQGTSMLCGLFAVNHMVGSWKYTADDFQQIEDQMTKLSGTSHTHCCCKGDYDVNILQQALESSGYNTQWMDARNQFTHSSISSLNSEGIPLELVGFLVNVPMYRDNFFMGLLAKLTCSSSRHWLCIKKIENVFFSLDSCENQPKLIPQDKLIATIEEYRQNDAIVIALTKTIQTSIRLKPKEQLNKNQIHNME